MGAETFTDAARKADYNTPDEAFNALVEQARYDYGHSGYTGTIAEKSSYFKVGDAESLKEAFAKADDLIDDEDSPVDDKWGPAGMIEYPEGWVFFGWASS